MGNLQLELGHYKGTIKKTFLGVESPMAPFYALIDYFSSKIGAKPSHLKWRSNTAWNAKKYKTETCYRFKDVELPLLDTKDERQLLGHVFFETLGPYLFFGNSYKEAYHYRYGSVFYGLETKDFKLVIEPEDVVIDAGSWIGDFAAYASCQGATTYAFEPHPFTYKILCETAQMNSNIIPVNKGLGDSNEEIPFFTHDDRSIGNTFVQSAKGDNAELKLTVTTLDDFVEENNLKKVDFIKSDIEGFERNLLRGAKNTLKRFSPKLAISTYHLPDDPQVLQEIILDTNPNYHIIHMPEILFAKVN